MLLRLRNLAVALVCMNLAAAMPTAIPRNDTLGKRSFGCDTLASGLDRGDCEWMASIGMHGQGVNAVSDNGHIWVGSGGANTFTFTNTAGKPSPAGVVLILWDAPAGDYQSSFMSARAPQVSYSLPRVGDRVTVSVAGGVSGGWAALTGRATPLSPYGQVYNTWGEFTTGRYATVDVSREVNMGGDAMSLRVSPSGCVADMDTCAFQCRSGNSCGASGSYRLANCAPGSQPGASGGMYGGNPSGGCQGWGDGGHIDVSLGRH